MIVIADTGTNNMASVFNALRRIGAREVSVAVDAAGVKGASALVLPGVGAFGDAMARLAERGLVAEIRRAVREDGVPILGICLGMQLLADESDEFGPVGGLGFVPGRIERLDNSRHNSRIPNIGWRRVTASPGMPAAFQAMTGQAAYFAHSYAYAGEPANVALWTEFDGRPIPCALCHGNVAGVQFHPEKSQDAGLDFLHEYFRSVVPRHLRSSRASGDRRPPSAA